MKLLIDRNIWIRLLFPNFCFLMLWQFMSPMNWSSLQTINSGNYSAPLYLKQPKLWIFFEDILHHALPLHLYLELIVICPWTEYILLIKCTNGIFFSLLVSVTFLEMWLYDSPIQAVSLLAQLFGFVILIVCYQCDFLFALYSSTSELWTH